MCCFYLLFTHVLRKNYEILGNLKSDKEYFVVPYFPDRVEFTRAQTPVDAIISEEYKQFMEDLLEADTTSYGVIVNTFQELEPAYVKDFKEPRSSKVWSIGPVSLCNKVLKVGVRVGVYQPMNWGEEEKIGELVDKEGVKKAVDELMGDSDDAKERRKRVKELGVLAHKAVEEGSSSHSNITVLLQDLMQLALSKN
ncbi:unnamed protein product [Microthlaspi erraticum]|uniref:Uncharacterized protein n=1 Tax=Microthlaspi erraticum TaxID=1685480 RepID=A0A6D2JQP6_9BRAS|nr:unnamed protein product [Microthlaspi erraticum]